MYNYGQRYACERTGIRGGGIMLILPNRHKTGIDLSTPGLILPKRGGLILPDDWRESIWRGIAWARGRMSLLGAGRQRPAAVGGGNDLLTNLIAYYDLEEASGTRADSSANGYDATNIRNAPGNTTGKNGNALSLVAASSQMIELISIGPGQKDILQGISVLSVNAWINPSDLTGDHVICCVQDANANGKCWAFATQGDELLLNIFESTETSNNWLTYHITDAANLSTSTTYMVTCTYNAGSITLYVNGSSSAGTDNGTIPTSIDAVASGTDDFEIGASNQGTQRFWDGWIDELALWERELSASDVSDLWNGGTGLFFSGFE